MALSLKTKGTPLNSNQSSVTVKSVKSPTKQPSPTPSTTLSMGGLPTVLSPTKVTSRRSLQDLEEFDSEYPIFFTPLLVSARRGNLELMELFYSRGERLESVEEHHNLGCRCRICKM
jgi:hypothetical protein